VHLRLVAKIATGYRGYGLPSLPEHSLHENQPLLTSCRNAEQITAAFPGYGLPISELISEGNVGLMQAIKRFEPERDSGSPSAVLL
jgi:DNA-directed RNA polymerase sigma subunit (sigma70/sigma32)